MKCKVINIGKSRLQEEIDNWLETGKYEIVETNQTQDSVGTITLTIFYLDTNEVRSKKLKKINKIANK